ncbi:MAG: CHAT domain-containing protein [Phormidesmis sp.]
MTATQDNREAAVVINFSQGSFQSGFDVSLQILDAGVPQHYAEIPALPPAPDLPALYQTWRSRYAALGGRTITPVANQPTHNRSAVQDCRAAAKALEQAMGRWFQNNSFKFLRNELRGQRLLLEDDSVPVIFNFRVPEADQLRRMPWHIWDLFRADFLNAEVVLQAQIAPRSLPAQGPLRVLTIYGSETGGINTEDDRAAWSALQSRQDISITALNQPTKSVLRQTLTQQPWDILFFAGHSSTTAESRHGTLQIGQHPDGSLRLIAIAQLKEDLRRAVQNGLKLAIFNSCDGLGIADLLTELKVPFTIVMREPVADLVARRFIQVFLQQFSQGKRFYRAVRAARRELDWLENDFHNPLPSATWLPIVLQNPSQPELQWPDKPKRKVPLLWLVAAVLGVVAVGWAIMQLMKRPNPSVAPLTVAVPYSSVADDNISLGEDRLTPEVALRIESRSGDRKQCDLPLKQSAQQAMSRGQYEIAQANFDTFLETCALDAEAEIYRNNAAILKGLLANGTSFEQLSDDDRQRLEKDTVMVPVPVPLRGDEPGIAQEIMRGAVIEQAAFNQSNSPRKMLLQVVNDDSTDDKNLSDAASEVAAILAQDPAVLAVIGHYNSDATEEAGSIYQAAGIVAVSPTSTAVRSQSVGRNDSPTDAFTLGDYIFRVSPSDQFNAKKLVQDMNAAGITRVLIAYVSKDQYSVSFKTVVEAILEENEIEVGDACNFSIAGGFNAKNCLEQNKGAGAIVLIPSAEVTNEAGELLKEANSKLPIWAGDAAYSNDNFERWGSSFDGAKIVIPWHPESDYNDGSILGKYDGKSWRTAMAYDATRALSDAIAQQQATLSGALTRQTLRASMAAPDFSADGILGPGSIQFDEAGDRRSSDKLGIIVEVITTEDGYDVRPIDPVP